MELTIREQQLFHSCKILFGTDLHISREFLDYLQLSGLKSAYRRRVLETHPDRVAVHDRNQRLENTESFHRVQKAYENLLYFVQGRKAHLRPAETFSRQTVDPATFHHDTSRGTGSSTTDHYYHGSLPNRPLLFGHFLYYSGLTNWRTIARILTCQRMERPRVGELGLRFGMLRSEDITLILRNKVPFQQFGQAATGLGMLSEYQLRVLIFHQQRMQKKFGTILLEKNLINPQELHYLLCEFERHNAAVAKGRCL